MGERLTEDDGRRALRDHVLERANIARTRYGPRIDAATIMKILDDRTLVRFPVGIRFDATALQPQEFAHAELLGEHPSEGYCLFIHPSLQSRTDLLPMVIAYHIPPINYGDITEPEDCEAFGAALLGMNPEIYYQTLCEIADALA